MQARDKRSLPCKVWQQLDRHGIVLKVHKIDHFSIPCTDHFFRTKNSSIRLFLTVSWQQIPCGFFVIYHNDIHLSFHTIIYRSFIERNKTHRLHLILSHCFEISRSFFYLKPNSGNLQEDCFRFKLFNCAIFVVLILYHRNCFLSFWPSLHLFVTFDCHLRWYATRCKLQTYFQTPFLSFNCKCI